MAEEWRSVIGFEGVYEVSDMGNLRRSATAVKCVPVKDGYLGGSLCRSNKKKNFRIHCLVAEAFLGERPEKYDVNHIDGDKTNNAVSNLEYITAGENQLHAFRLGLKSPLRGEKHPHAKITERQAREIIEKSPHVSTASLVSEYGISDATVRDIALGRTWSHLHDNKNS